MDAMHSLLFPRMLVTRRMTPEARTATKVVFLAIAMSLFLSSAGMRSYAQNSGAVTYSRQQLMDLGRQMREESRKTGHETGDPLERHLDPVTILVVRTKSGRAELHTTSADEFVVVQGSATLFTGGTIVNPQGTDEVRGDSLQDGVRAKLKAGDVVHIPANTPHQLLLDATAPLVYVLVKIRDQ